MEVDLEAITLKPPPFKIEGDGPFVAISRGRGTVCSFIMVLERSTHGPPNSEFLILRRPERMRNAGEDWGGDFLASFQSPRSRMQIELAELITLNCRSA